MVEGLNSVQSVHHYRDTARRITVMVNRLDKETTVEKLTEFLTSAGISDVKCYKLEPKEGQTFRTAAFKVSCDDKFKELLHAKDTWPDGCELRAWFFNQLPTKAF